MRGKRFLLGALLVTLLVAGVASYYASSHPDGLERVAEQTGFLDTGEDSPTADGPFAGYSTNGVDDERVSVGVTGVVGVVATLLLAGGLFWALRRRGGDLADHPSAGEPVRDDVDAEA